MSNDNRNDGTINGAEQNATVEPGPALKLVLTGPQSKGFDHDAVLAAILQSFRERQRATEGEPVKLIFITDGEPVLGKSDFESLRLSLLDPSPVLHTKPDVLRHELSRFGSPLGYQTIGGDLSGRHSDPFYMPSGSMTGDTVERSRQLNLENHISIADPAQLVEAILRSMNRVLDRDQGDSDEEKQRQAKLASGQSGQA